MNPSPSHPHKSHRVLLNGLAQARAAKAPADTILALRFAVAESALCEVAKMGGSQGIIAGDALAEVSETK